MEQVTVTISPKVLAKQGSKLTSKGVLKLANAGGIIADLAQAGFEVGGTIASHNDYPTVGKALKYTGKTVGVAGNVGAGAVAGAAIGVVGGPVGMAVGGAIGSGAGLALWGIGELIGYGVEKGVDKLTEKNE